MRVSHVIVGRVISPHGIHGRVVVESLTENPDRFARGSRIFVEDVRGEVEREVTVNEVIPYKGRLLMALSEVMDRDAAQELRGRYLCVPVDDLPAAGEGEYYHHQLVGLRALDGSGEFLGIVRSVVSLPAQDALVIEREGIEHLVPFVDEFVRLVDLEQEVIVIRDMPGLFEGK